MRIISKEEFDKIPADYKGVFADYQGDSPQWKGRRTAMLPGEGTTLSIEGVHFLVDGDYEHLPVINKFNARVGDCYIFAGGYLKVDKLFRITEEYARKHGLHCLDRVAFTRYTPFGTFDVECALPGSDFVWEAKQ